MWKFIVIVCLSAFVTCEVEDIGTKLYDKIAEKTMTYEVDQVCKQRPLELVFVLDASASIWYQNFTKAKHFVHNFIGQYQIGQDKVRIGIVTYATFVYYMDIIRLTSYDDIINLQKAVMKLPWRAGQSTRTGQALKYMRTDLFRDARPGVRRVAVVISDGKSRFPLKTVRQAALARNDSIEMYSIGVSDQVSYDEMVHIAGHGENVFYVTKYSELENIKGRLAMKTCSEVIRTTNPPPTTTTTESTSTVRSPTTRAEFSLLSKTTTTTSQPTTTTTTTTTTQLTTTPEIPQKDDACGIGNPADVYFVFDPTALGSVRTDWVTRFIKRSIRTEDMEHIQFGILSGSCPLDSGFFLNRYKDTNAVESHLNNFNLPKIPSMMAQLVENGFDTKHGGRPGCRKVSVLFMGAKVKQPSSIIKSVQKAEKAGVEMYFANVGDADRRLMKKLSRFGTRLDHSKQMIRQISHFLTELCSK